MMEIFVSPFQTTLRTEDQKPKTLWFFAFSISSLYFIRIGTEDLLELRTITYRPHGTIYVIFS